MSTYEISRMPAAPPTSPWEVASPTHQREVAPPTGRGPLTRWLLDYASHGAVVADPPSPEAADGFGADLQLALYLCDELHYSDVPGFELVDEWDPAIIGFRRTLEDAFVTALSATIEGPLVGDVRTLIPAIIDADTSPSVSSFMETRGTLTQMRQFLVHRSAYQLKEADPHTFGIPRLDGRPKQLLAMIQAGEYGADEPGRMMHAELFAQTMRSLGLDDRRHAYLDALPASALMVSNLISLFGLNRRWRGALVGHLAVFEMTSVTPMGRYSRGLDRMGAPLDARRFYDVHVLADAEHERQALEMAGELAELHPELVPDIVFGARCVLAIERMFAEDLLRDWSSVGTTTT